MSGSSTPTGRKPASGTATPNSETALAPLDKGGHQGNYSDEQHRTLIDFEQQLTDEGALDAAMLADEEQRHIILGRYLRARNWNITDAKKMYHDTLKWREEVELEQMMKPKEEGGYNFEERDVVAAMGWKMYFHSTDKYHRPIFVQDLSNLQVTEVFQHTTPERIIKFFALNLEDAVRHKYRACTKIARDEARAQGMGEEEVRRIIVDDNFMILNVAGLGMTTFWSFKGKLQQLLGILDANYPELSGRVQIINAPWLFTTIWSYVAPWLPPNTVKKIGIAGADFHKDLLPFIDPSELPVEMGGTCQCEVPGGCAFSNRGPWQDGNATKADTNGSHIAPTADTTSSNAADVPVPAADAA